MNETDFAKFNQVYNSTFDTLTRLKSDRHDLTSHWLIDLFHLMPIVRSFDATDPRDKIYSILAIAIDGQEEALRPNYDLCVEDVYLRFATHLIKKHNNLDILGHCFLEKNLSVPHWVPDWTVKRPFAPFAKREANPETTYGLVYNACNSRTMGATFLNNGQSLVVEGVLLDIISKVSDPRNVGRYADVGRDINLARAWTHFALGTSLDSPYTCGGTWLEALQHILCADVEDDDAQ